MGFELRQLSTFSPDLVPNDYWFFADRNKMLQRILFYCLDNGPNCQNIWESFHIISHKKHTSLQ